MGGERRVASERNHADDRRRKVRATASRAQTGRDSWRECARLSLAGWVGGGGASSSRRPRAPAQALAPEARKIMPLLRLRLLRESPSPRRPRGLQRWWPISDLRLASRQNALAPVRSHFYGRGLPTARASISHSHTSRGSTCTHAGTYVMHVILTRRLVLARRR